MGGATDEIRDAWIEAGLDPEDLEEMEIILAANQIDQTVDEPSTDDRNITDEPMNGPTEISDSHTESNHSEEQSGENDGSGTGLDDSQFGPQIVADMEQDEINEELVDTLSMLERHIDRVENQMTENKED